MEIWKDIYFEENGIIWDYRGLYSVSNEGRVKSLGRNGSGCTLNDKILKPGKNNVGYLFVILYKNGKHKTFKVHRLVSFMFIDGYFVGAEVNHKDENKENNNVDNLEWCTRKENCNYGTRNEKLGKSISKTRSKKVIGYSIKETKVIILKSTMQSEKFGFNQGHIVSCCNGKRNKHKGYIWKYLEED